MGALSGNVVYQWSQLTIANITSYYLYGDETDAGIAIDQNGAPVDLNDRVKNPARIVPKLTLDAASFMTTGPGRYANISQLGIIQTLFGSKSSLTQFMAQLGIEAGTVLTADQLVRMLAAHDGLPPATDQKTINKYYLRFKFTEAFRQIALDTGSSDYLARSYIYDSEAFKLDPNTSFDFEDDGVSLLDARLLPLDDNFDFKTDTTGFASKAINTAEDIFLREPIDPNFSGKTVDIVFDQASKSKIPVIPVYNDTNYAQDKARWSNLNSGTPAGLANMGFAASRIVSQLTQAGVITYTKDGKPVVYGTVGSDHLTGSAPGEILVGGTGDDVLIAKGDGNILMAGPGNNILEGDTGDDQFLFTKGVGSDVIIDNNLQSRIIVGSTTLGGASNLTGTDVWTADDGTTYTFKDTTIGQRIGTLVVANGALSGGTITILNFNMAAAQANGFLGLRFSEKNVVGAGVTTNPLLNGTGPTGTLALNAVGVSETLTAYASVTNSAPRTETFTASNASGIDISTGAQQLSLADGPVTLTIPAGQDSVTFELVDVGGSTSAQTVELTASLSSGDTGNSTVSSNVVDVTFAGQSTVIPTDVINGTAMQGTINGQSVSVETYSGDGSNDLITAVNGPTEITAGAGNDSIVGGSGNDTVTAWSGNDTISGGGGQDIFNLSQNVIVGNSIIFQDNGNNQIYAGTAQSLSDAISQAKSTSATNITGDYFAVGDGNNTIVGGAGNDVVFAGQGNNTIVFGNGKNILLGGFEATVSNNASVSFDGGTNFNFPSSVGPNFTIAGVLETVAGTAATTETGWGITGAGGAGEGSDTIFGGSGDSAYYLSQGDNYVDAGGGSDVIFASTASNNTIFGGSGNDTINGAAADNYIDAETGNDYIALFGGDSTVYGGTGNDTIYSGSNDANWATADSDNYIEAGSGNTSVFGAGGSDTIIGGSGNDTLFAGNGNQDLEGGSGNATIVGGAGLDTLNGGSGNDSIQAGSGATTIVGGDGLDTIIGGTGDDSITAGDGGIAGSPTKITAGTGNTTIVGGDGVDVITGGSGSNVISAGDGGIAGAPTTITAGSGATTITGGAGVDVIQGGSGTNLIYAGDGGTAASATQVTAGSGSTTIYGGAGVDTLVVGSGNDTLIAGAGISTLIGGSGTATYVFNADSGAATITNSRGGDTLSFGAGVSKSDLSVQAATINGRSGGAYITTAEGGMLTLQGGGLQRIQFADGSTASLSQLLADSYTQGTAAFAQDNYAAGDGITSVTLTGTSDITAVANDAGDQITANSGNDTLVAGQGNDTLSGGAGSTTYVMSSGTHVTTIQNSGSGDMLLLGTGVTAANLTATETLGTDGSNAITLENNQGGSVVINTSQGSSLDTIVFQDGSSASLSALLAQSSVGSTAGTSAADVTLAEGVQNMTLTGSANITATGNDLSDVITANTGNDTLVAGTGSDTLVGGSGNTTYDLNQGFTNVAINESGTGDTLAFGAGITESQLTTTSAVVGGVTVTTITDESGDTVTVNGGGLSQVTFASGDPATLTQLLSPSYTVGTTVYSNIDMTAAAGIEAIALTGNADLTATANTLNDTLVANAGNDTLVAGAGNDTLVGGGMSDDYVVGNGAQTTTVENSGSSDTLIFGNGVSIADLSATAALAGDSTEVITIQNDQGGSVIVDASSNGPVDQIQFADGSTASLGALLAQATTGATAASSNVDVTLPDGVQNMTLTGTAALTVTGNGLDDVITANSGNDTLVAGSGIDTLVGGAGNVTYDVSGTSFATIANSGAGDTLILGDAIQRASLSVTSSVVDGQTVVDLVSTQGLEVLIDGGALSQVSFGGTTESLEQLLSSADMEGTTLYSSASVAVPEGIQTIQLTGSADLSATANALDDTLAANAGNDTLVAGTGDDTLIGGGFSDDYVVASGAQVTTIEQSSAADTLSYGAGVSASDISVSASEASDGSGEIITLTNDLGGSVVLAAGQSGNVDNLSFVGGATASVGVMLAQLTTGITAATSDSDVALGDVIQNMTLTGAASLTAEGNSLDDVINANTGDDTLVAGTGNDTFLGGAAPGTDTYVIGSGAGNVAIQGSGGIDTLEYGEGVSVFDLGVSAEIINGVTTLSLDDGGFSGIATIQGGGLDQVAFFDGSVVSAIALAGMATTTGTDHVNTDGSDWGANSNADGSATDFSNDAAGDTVLQLQDTAGNATGEMWSRADGSHGNVVSTTGGGSTSAVYNENGTSSQTTTNASGNSTTTYYLHGIVDGTRTVTKSNGGLDTSTSEFDTNGNLTGSSTATADGSGNSTTQYFSADGFLGSTVVTIGSDGSATTESLNASGALTGYTVAVQNVNETITTTTFNASGTATGSSVATAEGPGLTSNILYDASGVEIGTSRTLIASSGDSTTTAFNLSGVETAASWKNADGTSGSETFSADGSTDKIITNADRSYADFAVDSAGNVTTTQYAANNTEKSQAINRVDGSSSIEAFSADRSTFTVATQTDGSYSDILNNGFGTVTTTSFTAAGLETEFSQTLPDGQTTTTLFPISGGSGGDDSNDQVVVSDDGLGDTTTTTYDANGNEISQATTFEDGSSNSELINLDGSGSGNTHNTDGTSSSFVRDAAGDVTTDFFDTSGRMTNDTIVNVDGSTETDTFNTDGSSNGTTTAVDGSYSTYTNDGHGNFTITYFDPFGDELHDAWTMADGSSGTDVFNSDGTSSGTITSASGVETEFTKDSNGDIVSSGPAGSELATQVNAMEKAFIAAAVADATAEVNGQAAFARLRTPIDVDNTYDVVISPIGASVTHSDDAVVQGSEDSGLVQSESSNSHTVTVTTLETETVETVIPGNTTLVFEPIGGPTTGPFPGVTGVETGRVDIFDSHGDVIGIAIAITAPLQVIGSTRQVEATEQITSTAYTYTLSGNIAEVDAGADTNTIYLGSGPIIVNAGDGNNVYVGPDDSVASDANKAVFEEEQFNQYSNYFDLPPNGLGFVAPQAQSFIYGGAGSDTLVGSSGDDTIVAGTGNDFMNGGAGADTYVINTSADTGTDIVDDTGYYDPSEYVFPGTNDPNYFRDLIAQAYGGRFPTADEVAQDFTNTLQFNGTVTLEQLTFTWVQVATAGNRWALGISWGTDGQVEVVMPDADKPGEGIQNFIFGDGTSLTLQQILALAPGRPTDAPPTVAGSTYLPTLNVGPDQPVNYVVPANLFVDVDPGDAITFSITQADGTALPSWLTFDPSTRTLTGIPPAGVTGSLALSVVGTDIFGQKAQTALNVGVFNDVVSEAGANTFTTLYDASNVAISDTWSGGGETGTDAFRSDGTVVGTAGFPGSFSAYFNNGSGTVITDNYQGLEGGSNGSTVVVTDSAGDVDKSTFAADGFKTLEQETFANGNSQTKFYNAGGSSEELIQNAGGGFTNIEDDGQGDIFTEVVDASGNLVSEGTTTGNPLGVTDQGVSTSTDDGNGNTETINYDGSGVEVSDSWTKADGSFGADAFNQDGSSSGVTTNADGTSTAYIKDSSGRTETIYYDTNGVFETQDAGTSSGDSPPVLAVPLADVTEQQGQAFSFAVPAGAFTDPDTVNGDTLTYSAKLASGDMLPSWLQFDAATQTFSGTALAGDVGMFSVQVFATDNAGVAASSTFALNVDAAPVNQPPVVVNDTASINADAATMITGNVLTNDSDPNAGIVLTVAAPGTYQSTDGTLVIASDGSYTYAVNTSATNLQALAASQSTTDVFQYSAHDNDPTDPLSTAGSLTITINGVNNAPVAAAPLNDQLGVIGTAFSYTVPTGSFTDVDQGDSLTYTAGLVGAAGTIQALPNWLSFNAATDTFSGTPSSGNAGSFVLEVTATDSQGASVTSDFNLGIASTGDLGTSGVDSIFGGSGNDVVFGGDGDDDIDGNAGNDTIYGGAGDDAIFGNAGNDYLNGGPGADDMEGGAGNDTYVVDNVGDQVWENNNQGTDTVISSINWTLGFYLENLTLSGSAALRGTGNTLANVITANSAGDYLSGGAGADTLLGGSGNDTLNGGTGNDSLNGGAGNDTYVFNPGDGLDEIVENDSVNGTHDAIQYGEGITPDSVVVTRSGENLVLTSGADVITVDNWFASTTNKVQTVQFADGSTWNRVQLLALIDAAPVVANPIADQVLTLNQAFSLQVATNTFSDADAGDTMTLSAAVLNTDGSSGALPSWLTFNATTGTFSGTPATANAGTWAVQVIATDSFGASTETMFNIIAGTSAQLGTSGDDSFFGGSGNDMLYGLAGNDSMGGNGGNDSLYGGVGNDTLGGNAGNDYLDGGPGADQMFGNAGDDTYVVDNAGDVVGESANQGTDTVLSSINYILPSNVENLTLIGTAALDGTGNTLANVLTGNGGNDLLSGGAGNDTLIAGSGNDALMGGTGNDSLVGGNGNDTLDGGAGNDTMIGGAGDDVYYVDNPNDVIVEAANGGNDTVVTAFNLNLSDAAYANVENARLLPANVLPLFADVSGTVTVTTSAGLIASGVAANLVNGDPGAESADAVQFANGVNVAGQTITYDFGGAYTADQFSWKVDNPTSSGTWQIRVSNDGTNWTTVSANFALGSSVSQVVDLTASGGYRYWQLYGVSGTTSGTPWNEEGTFLYQDGGAQSTSATTLTGSSLNNLLTGNDANNALTGGTAMNFLEGLDGDDLLNNATGTDTGYYNGGAGNDTINGGSGAELFIGGQGNDVINTGGGADLIAFNKGDGQDVVTDDSPTTPASTISLGGGIELTDLTLSKQGSDLLLNIGGSDQIDLKNWYAGDKAVLNLQVVEQAAADFSPSGNDALRSSDVETFNFAGLVGQFDSALVANPTLTSWSLTNALAQFQLSGSDTQAIGGDLAYQYGLNGTMTGIALSQAQSVTSSASFGTQSQTLHPLATLQEGTTKLS